MKAKTKEEILKAKMGLVDNTDTDSSNIFLDLRVSTTTALSAMEEYKAQSKALPLTDDEIIDELIEVSEGEGIPNNEIVRFYLPTLIDTVKRLLSLPEQEEPTDAELTQIGMKLSEKSLAKDWEEPNPLIDIDDETGMYYCTTCNSGINEGAKYCWNCGKSLSEPTVKEPMTTDENKKDKIWEDLGKETYRIGKDRTDRFGEII